MPVQVQFRRGTTAQHATFTGAVGELSVDTTKDVVVVHDGTQAGGHPMMSAEGGVFTGNVSQTIATAATSKTSGAFITAGGVGVGKDLWAQAIYDSGNRVFTQITSTVPSVLAVSSSANVCTVSPQDSGATAGTYGSASQIPQLTVDQYGRVTSITTVQGSSSVAVQATDANSTHYISFIDATSGATTAVKVDTNLTYNPSSNTMYAGSFQISSDAALKDNIATIANPLDLVSKLRGVDFTWKKNGKKSIGFVAQEVEQVIPQVVDTQEVGKSVAYSNIVAVLIEAVKEQQKEIDALKAKV